MRVGVPIEPEGKTRCRTCCCCWRWSSQGTASHGISARFWLKSEMSASAEANTISNGRLLPKNSWYLCSNSIRNGQFWKQPKHRMHTLISFVLNAWQGAHRICPTKTPTILLASACLSDLSAKPNRHMNRNKFNHSRLNHVTRNKA